MKKSQMIEHMAFCWLKLDDPNSEYAQSLSLKDKMGHLLNLMEDYGINPPVFKEKIEDNLLINPLMGFKVKERYKWEPEDAILETQKI